MWSLDRLGRSSRDSHPCPIRGPILPAPNPPDPIGCMESAALQVATLAPFPWRSGAPTQRPRRGCCVHGVQRASPTEPPGMVSTESSRSRRTRPTNGRRDGPAPDPLGFDPDSTLGRTLRPPLSAFHLRWIATSFVPLGPPPDRSAARPRIPGVRRRNPRASILGSSRPGPERSPDLFMADRGLPEQTSTREGILPWIHPTHGGPRSLRSTPARPQRVTEHHP